MLDRITPVVLTRDEEANVARTLGALAWAREVIVVDSFSTDATANIAGGFPNVRLVQRTFDTLAGQSNYGIALAQTPWVLLMDADYVVPAEFVDELRSLDPPENVAAYRAAFRYAIDGRPLRASLYPPRIVLLRRDRAGVWQDGHAHRVRAEGDTSDLKSKLIHDDRKPFSRFLERQRRYMRDEAEKLRNADPKSLNFAARVRKLIVVAPFAVLVHTLFAKGLVLDGVPGLKYAWERFVAEWILSREMLRRRSRTQNAERRTKN